MRALLLLALLPACIGGDKDTAPADTDDTDTDVPVDGCPVAVVTPDVVELLDLPIDFSAAAEVSIVNNCAGTTALSVIPSITGLDFFVESTPISVAPGEVGSLAVVVTPASYADLAGTLVLETNDPAAPTIEVPVSATVDADRDDDGHTTVDAGGDDCDDADAAVNPGAAELYYDGVDQDCDGASDDDADGDGHDAIEQGGDDCDDADASVSPSAAETWYDGLDQDCAGDDDYDADADGFVAPEGGGLDCDDLDVLVFPGAEDAWYDGVDANCDGASDYDQDADGFDDVAWGGEDCADLDATIHPDATEGWYDGVDQDCDGASDFDQDADGADALVGGGGDCADTDPAIGPGAAEVYYDGVDQDCDGASDYDADADGFDATSHGGGDCHDLAATVNPAASEAWYDGLDQDCDGASDYDRDGDGFDSDAHGGADCDDLLSSVRPGATETWYDGVDADCDGASDYDQDGDGYDSDAWGGDDCLDTRADAYPGAVDAWYDGVDGDCDGASDYDQDGDGVDRYPEGADCADTDAGTTAGTTETRNGLDDDCDGTVDEGFATAGDIVITEVMPNPYVVGDNSGEWFEVYNPTAYDVDMTGWVVYSDDGQSMTLGALVVAAGDYAVLGTDDIPSRNGGVTVDYEYMRASFAFSDAGDSIYLQAGSTTVAEVSWTVDWPFAAGYSMQLDPDHYDAIEATDEAYWCISETTFGSGDRGTPNGANAWCPNVDHDGDGESADDGDCDDTDASVYASAPERFDGVDQDCDGTIDDVIADLTAAPYVVGETDYANLVAAGFGDTDGDGALEVGFTQSDGRGAEGMYVLDGADFRSWGGSPGSYDVAYVDPGSPAGYGTAREWSDLDGDGLADLPFVYDPTSGYGRFAVYSDPAGTLGLSDAFLTGTGSRAPDSAGTLRTHVDLTGDGVPELVYGDSSNAATYAYGGLIEVYDVAGVTGDVTPADALLTVTPAAISDAVGFYVELGDVSGDGHADVVVGTNSGSYYSYVIDGGGLATARSGTRASLSYLTIPDQVTTSGDYDDDGVLDLATANERAVFTNLDGRSGTLALTDATSRVSRSMGAYDNCQVSALQSDIDGDGVGDLVYYATIYPNYNRTFFFGTDALASASIDEDDAFATLTLTGLQLYPMVSDYLDLDGDGVEEFVAWDGGSRTTYPGVATVWEP